MPHFRSILVPVIADPASFEAVAIAASLAKQEKGTVRLVHVIEVGRTLPLDAEMDAEARRGEEILRRARGFAREAHVTVEDDLLQARDAGQAIVEDAEASGAEVIIMGLGYKPLMGDFRVGHTADYVLKHAPCQVWLVRQPLGAATPTGSEVAARR